ncbi:MULTISPECIES: D-alanine--D-alanine ligase [Sinorhizobium]|uniref:D-alanine--D-alanine ligase n=1 Tax=Sinorhizobium americanum TaxID=194963 RepID=A0A2S3YKE4_9HYPH|nr:MULTISPECIES: D-alanine--D-alanine ligase [Sinorhizobium]PDT32425.1 D-alanine--D-alanine ligase [Sinorhizobium sp. FG01]PDT47684.1 D-alanine--D-alanine ligase [Sinorhizobium sp. NG07B]POH28444.1 D-alanine--D-alanine ligase [Sinorhizobium americanum]POH28447.1 D-alanine--D-alanine ligase [Sinorhizobium americanum]
MQLALMYGGRSVEHDGSIAMYNHIADVLNNASNADISPVSIYYISRSGDLLRLALDGDRLPKHDEFATRAETHPLASLAHLLKREGLFVFSLLQGQDGEDGQIQALAQFHDIPGSFGDKTAAMLSADKYLQGVVANRLCLELTPIPTVQVSQGNFEAGIKEALRHLAGPCVLKPNTLGGSFLTECTDKLSEDGLRSYSERIAPFDASFLVQQRIFGTEYTCGILIDHHEIMPLPIARINNPSGFLGYVQKKTRSSSYSVEFHDVEEKLQTRIASISTKIAREFRLHTFGRLDFIVDEQQRVHFFEINLVPGLTANCMFTKMLAKAGFDLCHVIRLAASNEANARNREKIRKIETSRVC